MAIKARDNMTSKTANDISRISAISRRSAWPPGRTGTQQFDPDGFGPNAWRKRAIGSQRSGEADRQKTSSLGECV